MNDRPVGSSTASEYIARRVLIADDSPVLQRLLQAKLSGWGYDVILASDGGQAWKVLSSPSPPPLALIDWMMPVISGVELCQRVRSRKDPPYVYTILLTGRAEKSDIVHGLAAGADDYVVKPFDEAELEVRLRAGWRIAELEHQLRYTQSALARAALQDSLTGVFNRRAILSELERELARARRKIATLGLLMIDLDGFKECNDVRGHLEGDRALVEFTARILAVVRREDILGRYGGDEFILIAPGCHGADLLELAERIRFAICSEPVALPSGELRLTASIGVAQSHAGQQDAESLLRAADEALYVAKRSGRNRVIKHIDLAGDITKY
jgi:diguanylate cyclase (GGDEF)-like protein